MYSLGERPTNQDILLIRSLRRRLAWKAVMHSFFTIYELSTATAIQRPTNPIFEVGVVKARRAEMTLTTNEIDDVDRRCS
jgi:hypothetical protein